MNYVTLSTDPFTMSTRSCASPICRSTREDRPASAAFFRPTFQNRNPNIIAVEFTGQARFIREKK